MESSIPLRRFELKDDKSYKFWAIELDDKSHTVTYGRIGTKGKSMRKEFASSGDAKASYEILIQQKVKKGYKELIKKTKVRKSPDEIRRERQQHEPFEKAIIESPDDSGAYAVYSDWLTDREDPRGEFIRIQLELEDPKLSFRRRIDLEQQERSALAKHARAWLGELTPFLVDQKEALRQPGWPRGARCFEYRFARGLLECVQMRLYSRTLAQALGQSHLASLLRELLIDQLEPVSDRNAASSGESYGSEVVSALKDAQFDNLRCFRLGSEDHRVCQARGTGVVELLHQMPRLENLHLAATDVDAEKLFTMELPTLRSLTIYHLHHYPIELLAENSSLTNLESLHLIPQEGCTLNEEIVATIAQSAYLRNLTRLRLWRSQMGERGIAEIVESGLLSRLEELDLTHGSVSDVEAQMLAESPDMRSLHLLVLDVNPITAEGIKELKKTGILNLQANSQLEDSRQEQGSHEVQNNQNSRENEEDRYDAIVE